MSHDVRQCRGDDKAPEVNPSGTVSNDCQLAVSKTLGQPGLGQYLADDNGCKDEQHGRSHEIAKGLFCRMD